MLLIYTQKITPRITYIFKHICLRILGIEVSFTSVVEELIAYNGPKLSYGKQPMGNEFFIQSHGLLLQQGFESEDIIVKPWEDTKCFFSVSDKSALPFDIFSASFYLLSRYEEYLPHVKDEIGRFPATESLGFTEGFLKQPVVDIWAYKFKDVLLESFPSLLFPSKKIIIHNIVQAREPFAYRQKGFFRSTIGFANDIFNFRIKNLTKRTRVILGLMKDPYNTFNWLIATIKKNKVKLSVFFLLGEATVFEESLNTNRKKFRMLIKFISDYKEVGLVFSFASLKDNELQKKEKLQMEDITNRSLKSSINDQYLVNLPDIYRNLVEIEIENDFTMFYDKIVGFRAGTCTPFLFYDLDYEIKTPLKIHPVSITTNAFKGKNTDEINKTVDEVLASVEKVNGTFTILFSNKDFYASEENKIWRTLFSEKLQQYE